MNICPVCACGNDETNRFCSQCGFPFTMIVVNPTERQPGSGPIRPNTTWGETKRLHNESLILQVAGTYERILLPDVSRIVVGRLDTSDDLNTYIDLAPFGPRAKSVSRLHALFEVAYSVTLMDLESTNGTFLNGFRLMRNQPRIVRDGDEVRFGDFITFLYFRMTGAAQSD